MEFRCRPSHLSVRRSAGVSVYMYVGKVYCGKTADWIRRGRGSFGASHCN